MRRGPKPAKSKEAKPPVARKSPTGSARVRDLEKRLADALKREAEGREQQTATAEILRVISRSRTDIQSVLDAVAENAARLCHVEDVSIIQADGGIFRVLAYRGAPRLKEFEGTPVNHGSVAGRAILDGRVVHVPDVTEMSEAEFSVSKALVEHFGHSTMLATPLLREGKSIGAVFVRRTKVRPFSDIEIQLLQTFADQAVIAIENVRLFTELQEKNQALTTAHAQATEALDQQTATSEILRVISQSPTDVQPVFDAMVESAVRLCAGRFGALYRFDGELIYSVARHNYTPEALEEVQRVYPTRPSRALGSGRAILDREVIHIPDVEHDPEFHHLVLARATGWRSGLFVPMLRDGMAIGAIAVLRAEPGRFSDSEIELLKTFGDQAVIAIENVRLFKELETRNADLTDALSRQTATSEILRVISGSPTDVQPVFDTIIKSAVRLCDGVFGGLDRFDGDLIYPVAEYNYTPEALDAMHRVFPARPSRGLGVGRAILDCDVVHIPDVELDPEYRVQNLAGTIGFRSGLFVPMLRDGVPIGVILVGRAEPGPFSDNQIALLRTFADQAVIAIENVRLFNELQGKNLALSESLEQQTATADILRVISRSPTDEQPVFDAIIASAVRLLGGHTCGLIRVTGDQLELVALTSIDAAADAPVRAAFPQSLHAVGAHPRAIRDRVPFNVADAYADARLAEGERAFAGVRGFRSWVVVPMLRDDVTVGSIGVTRREAGGFTADEIALLQMFADQAVIAIENVRLFNETKEALERQTATSEILSVISSSPTDIQPVLTAVAESAAQLCQAYDVTVFRVDGDVLRLVAHHGPVPATPQLGLPIVRDTVGGRSILEARTIQVADAQVDDGEYPLATSYARKFGHRTLVSVPLLREGVAIGAIQLRRTEVAPFTDTQIALLQTFADQAVIAIENVRLFTELQEKNRALTEAHAQVSEALDQQTATSEVLRVISSSPTDLQPVFDAIVRSAVLLCGGTYGTAVRFDGELMHLAAGYNYTPEVAQALHEAFPMRPSSRMMSGRAILSGDVVQVGDALEDSDYSQEVARAGGFRSMLAAPMLRDGRPIGAIVVNRGHPGRFSATQIGLLQTFADQAVIAIENVRLFTELQERTQDLTRSVEQLTALGEVGRAVSSTLDLETVLSTIVSRAVQLSGTDGGSVYEYDEATEEFTLRASRDLPEAYVEQVRDTRPRKGDGAVGRVALTREPVQIVDISDAIAYDSRVRTTLLQIGLRALLAVPLIAEDHLVGALIVMRKRSGTFAAEEVALLQTFATQSALAIQNARLFREIEDKSRQLEVASQHKSEFLANMSHELRTPLNAIIGFSEVLSERMFGELNEKQEEYSKDIHASGQHLLSLINDILDLSKIEAGRMELELTEFDLPTALDSSLTLIRERAGRRGITLQMNVDSQLGQIQADERKVRQVVLNLLSNAIKFTPEGGRIEVGAVSKDRLVEVSVTDTGVGIAPEDQEAVFEEFRQVGTADKKVEGTGLGLTLCRKFVELHGGKISVKSEVGVGSTFVFTLPVRHGE